ncbi:MAG: TonB family protein [Terriglobales bacterium]
MKPDPTHTNLSAFAKLAPVKSPPESHHSYGPGQTEYLPTDYDSEAMDSEQMVREVFVESAQEGLAGGRRDYRTGALTAAVIALSLLLGWMVGRAGWNMAVNRAQNANAALPEEVLATAEYSPPLPNQAEKPLTPVVPDRILPVLPRVSSPAPKSKVEPVHPDDALVMYERGKMIFRAKPPEATSPSAQNTGTKPTELAGKSNPLAVAEQDLAPATNGSVLTRVQPHYPEEARQQGVQGSVMLTALVGVDGSVQEVKVMSGNPQLAQAATDAVRQWRFQPRLLRGQPARFESRITIHFLLP